MGKAADYILPLGILGAVVVGGYFLLKGGLPFFGDIGEGVRDFFDKLFGERAKPIITPEWEEAQAAKFESIEESMQRTRAAIERVKGITERMKAAPMPVLPRVSLIETFQPGQITYETAALYPVIPTDPSDRIRAQMRNGRYIPSGRI